MTLPTGLFRFLARNAVCITGVVMATGCASPRFDFWGIEYHAETEGVAVTHLVVRSGDRILDENHQLRPDGSLSRYYRESFSGRLPRPDAIYVQWVEDASGAVHDQKIQLKGLLPASLEDRKLRLVFKGGEVYLFVRHLADTTLDRPLIISPAPQLFPDPTLRPYVGNERPESFEQPSN